MSWDLKQMHHTCKLSLDTKSRKKVTKQVRSQLSLQRDIFSPFLGLANSFFWTYKVLHLTSCCREILLCQIHPLRNDAPFLCNPNFKSSHFPLHNACIFSIPCMLHLQGYLQTMPMALVAGAKKIKNKILQQWPPSLRYMEAAYQ